MTKRKEKTVPSNGDLDQLFKVLDRAERLVGIAEEKDPRKRIGQAVILFLMYFCAFFMELDTLVTLWDLWRVDAISQNIYLSQIAFCISQATLLTTIFICLKGFYKKSLLSLISWHSKVYPVDNSFVKFSFHRHTRHLKVLLTRLLKVFPLVASLLFILNSVFVSLMASKFYSAFPDVHIFWSMTYNWYYEAIKIARDQVVVFFVIQTTCMHLGIIIINYKHFIAALEAMSIVLRRLPSPFDGYICKEKFNKTINMVIDMHCDLIEAQGKFFAVVSPVILAWEFLCYGCFLIAWLIYKVSPEQMLLAVEGLIQLFPYFLICFFNEKLADSYESFSYTLYNIEWYRLRPMERKTLLTVMVMARRPTLLQAGPFHVVGFESFADMLNRAYSYGVFLTQNI